MTLKPDTQVLDEAISSLEKEGVWCQGTWLRKTYSDVRPVVIGMCAEGAIRIATGCYDASQTMNTPDFDLMDTVQDDVIEQVDRIEAKVRDHMVEIRNDLFGQFEDAYPAFPLSAFNDHHGVTASDVILAMKHAREDLANG